MRRMFRIISYSERFCSLSQRREIMRYIILNNSELTHSLLSVFVTVNIVKILNWHNGTIKL